MNLSKLGSFLKRAGAIAQIVLEFTPLKAIKDEIAAAILEAEAIPGASGPEKLNHVLNIAFDAIKAVNDQAGKVVIPLDRVAPLVTLLVNAIIAAVNASAQAKIAA